MGAHARPPRYRFGPMIAQTLAALASLALGGCTLPEGGSERADPGPRTR